MDIESATSNKKKILTVIAMAAVLVVAIGMFVVLQKIKIPVQPITQIEQTQPEPQKTDFGINMPTDFPSDIPVEKGVKVEQSYSLNYVGQKQLTIVFQSTKTVKENYTLYSVFLEKENWNISNKYEGPKVSSLYGTKESNEINVAISGNTAATSTKSRVSISVLKK